MRIRYVGSDVCPSDRTPLYAWYALTRTWYVPSCGVGNSHTSELPALYGRQSYTESVASSANFTYRSASPVPPVMVKTRFDAPAGTSSVSRSAWLVPISMSVTGTPFSRATGTGSRAEERRVGNACFNPGRSRTAP